MKSGVIFRGILLIMGIIVLSFNVLLYNFCEQQKNVAGMMSAQQKVESQVSSNKFKYQEEQIEGLSKDIAEARQQIKNQGDVLSDEKNALLQEVEKRQQLEDNTRTFQTSLVDIKAEADAIKQEMKGWQKDYVSVLAELDKKTADSQDEIKSLDNNLTALNIPELKENVNSLKADIEKMTHPPDNGLSGQSPLPEKKIEHEQFGSQ
jgi:chromosome segregation ATPase